MKPIFIYGASGHAKVVVDIIEAAKKYQVAILADDAPNLKGTDFYGYPVIGGKDDLLRIAKEQNVVSGIIAIGDNKIRSTIDKWCAEQQFELVSAIHPSANIAKSVEIEAGTVVMAGVVINADSKISRNNIINSGSIIDHDCYTGDSVHIAPGVILCGNVQIGELTLIGAGSTVIPNLKIGSEVVVGAGATVVKNIPKYTKVAGIPAKPLI